MGPAERSTGDYRGGATMCNEYSSSAPQTPRRSPEIRMSVSIRRLDDEEREYFFSRQLKFCANEKLAVERSENFMIPKSVSEPNIWKKKPPDFSVRLYRSLNLPRRLEENRAKETKNVNQIPMKNMMEAIRDAPPPALNKSKEPKRFFTRFKPLDPLEGSILYVKEGLYPKEKYKDPRPHDFRQYPTGFPDFATSYSRDPFNLKFKAQSLSSSCDLPPIEAKRSAVRVKRLVLHRPADPQWDSQLILPRSPWPPKSASYTRHRRRRGVYSAFMDRVEEKFTASNHDHKEEDVSCLREKKGDGDEADGACESSSMTGY